MRKRLWLAVVFALLAGNLLAVLLYQLPPVYTRLSWRVENLRTKIRYALNPPGEAVFVPQEETRVATIVFLPASELSHTPGDPLLLTSTPSPTSQRVTETPTLTLPPTVTPTAIPERVLLTGAVHEYQQMNNCGPATLSMALSYWGWHGDQRDTRAVLRPNFATVDDKNVSPYEMAGFVETQTDLKAVVRVGGDLTILKRLVAAGFPIIIEKGFQPPKEDWMGHYALITGYDDTRNRFITQDAYIMPDFPVPYTDLSDRWWRDFNNIYMVIFPAEKEVEVIAILGHQMDPVENFVSTAQRAAIELEMLTGRDLFFAWYNLGTNQLGLSNYVDASQSYDRAFAIYANLSEGERPWRMLWYQVGPYEAYFHTGRYQDVITLASQTLSFLGAPILEESLFWRGLAKEASGDLDGAILDLRKAAEINPTSTDVLAQLQRLGVEFP